MSSCFLLTSATFLSYSRFISLLCSFGASLLIIAFPTIPPTTPAPAATAPAVTRVLDVLLSDSSWALSDSEFNICARYNDAAVPLVIPTNSSSYKPICDLSKISSDSMPGSISRAAFLSFKSATKAKYSLRSFAISESFPPGNSISLPSALTDLPLPYSQRKVEIYAFISASASLSAFCSAKPCANSIPPIPVAAVVVAVNVRFSLDCSFSFIAAALSSRADMRSLFIFDISSWTDCNCS